VLSAREALSVLRSIGAAELAWLALGVLCVVAARFALRGVAQAPGGPAVLRMLLGAALALLLVVRLHAWFAAGQLSPAVRAELARASLLAPRLAVVCAPDGVRDFVPALSGRPAGEPGVWVPPPYAEEWRSRARRPCTAWLEEEASVR
jgi:hypothetical protein